MLTTMVAALVAAQPAPAPDPHAQHMQAPQGSTDRAHEHHDGMKKGCCEDCCKDMGKHEAAPEPKRN